LVAFEIYVFNTSCVPEFVVEEWLDNLAHGRASVTMDEEQFLCVD